MEERLVAGERTRKKMSLENRNPRTRETRQQRQWKSNQKIDAGDLATPPSAAASEDLKLALRRLM